MVPLGQTNSSQKMRGYSEDVIQHERKRSLSRMPIFVDDELRASPCEAGPSRSCYLEGISGMKSTKKDEEIDIV